MSPEPSKSPPESVDPPNHNHLLTIPICTGTAGGIIGFIRSSRMASLRFLAENAHRPPTTLQGWYFYNKTKNYRVLLAGFKGGGREALRLGSMGCAWVALEQGWLSFGDAIDAPWVSSCKEIVAGTGTAAVIASICKSRQFILYLVDHRTELGLRPPRCITDRNYRRLAPSNPHLNDMQDRFPRRMALRTIGLGLGMGATVSALRMAQFWLGRDLEKEKAVITARG